ncbi:tetrahydrobiopterin biosynthesis enzymes-like protein [Agrocybe pediades]|nr:tetrahydrobiopterin biosynthesis enzymes-like protein [Agrocybe pediades]
MAASFPTNTDTILVDSLSLSASIGSDCWGKARPQPIELSVHLHLSPNYLNTSGSSDDVLDSVHYGHLTKSITALFNAQPNFNRTDDLIRAVTGKAFEIAGDAVQEVRVVVDASKHILLASGFSVDAVISRASHGRFKSKKVSVRDIVVPVIIGVNPPERESKQRVIVNVIFYENVDIAEDIPASDYQEIIKQLVAEIEPTSYLTLEKFVMHLVQSACTRSSNRVAAVTVRAQKPSALSFAHSSGVEITRTRDAFTSSS